MSTRPIMLLLDLLGQRWTLRLLWELRDGPLTFRGLRERADALSPSVLNDRLKSLKMFGFVDSSPVGYALTARGAELAHMVGRLNGHARGWAEADGGWPPDSKDQATSAPEGAG